MYTHETIYKALDGTRSMHGGDAEWTPGEWMPVIEGIVPCERGYHLCTGPLQLLEWLGPDIWIAEYRGEIVPHDNKLVVSEARITERVETWTERTARLFAADCAEHVLHIYERNYSSDNRPRHAIETARRYANGEATDAELAAAWAAAADATWDAAGGAAWAAAWAAAGAAARGVAWDAARGVAWDAAGAAVRNAARAAAWAAAWDAEWDAARAAAWVVARDAARAAAADAASAAERQWQAERLLAYLNGEV